jgi:hypothetical protein
MHLDQVQEEESSSRAFSSEVATGSREENASKQKSRAPLRFNRNGKGCKHYFRKMAADFRIKMMRKQRILSRHPLAKPGMSA